MTLWPCKKLGLKIPSTLRSGPKVESALGAGKAAWGGDMGGAGGGGGKGYTILVLAGRGAISSDMQRCHKETLTTK
jgi:hypothetical protein